MFQSGLLVLSASRALRRNSPQPVIQRCCELIHKTLYVHLVNDDGDFSQNPVPNVVLGQGVRQYVVDFYANASHLSKSMDVRFVLSNISNEQISCLKPLHLRHGYDVILTDFDLHSHSKLLHYVTSIFPNSAKGTEILKQLSINAEDNLNAVESQNRLVDTYNYVVLGGTFDRLHVGHKILLSEGCLLCNKALTVGVTDGEMNKRKILAELMQPTAERISAVIDFLLDIKPCIEYKVPPITDLYGPTITDPSLQCLIVSRETIKGWEMINAKRKNQGMSELKQGIIDLVQDLCHSEEEEEKVSSSTSRIRLLGTLMKNSKDHRVYGKKPFVIGLTGGIASGKSSIGKRLEKLGAGIVDCDALGHRSYQPGTPTLHRLVEVFGTEIVGSDGFIDRKALGAKVFGNKEKMSQLNKIVWPAISQLAAEEVKTLADEGKQVVVLDAAVLLEAGWEKMVDEVWTTVIPKEEAVKRLVGRNRLSEEQARQRLESQITNEERVSQADVILCTLWEPEVTQKQVEKAWALLQDRLTTAQSTS